MYYNRIVIENTLHATKVTHVVKCVIPGGQDVNGQFTNSSHRVRRQSNFDNFTESAEEHIDWSGNFTGRAPIPLLNIAVRQNGQLIDTALNVSPGKTDN